MWNFSIVHQPGDSNSAADATSRHPTPVSPYAELASSNLHTQADKAESSMLAAIRRDVNGLKAVTWQHVQAETELDDILPRLFPFIQNGFPKTKSQMPSSLAAYWEFRDSLFIADGIIMYNDRAVIPQNLRRQILSILHAAHQGVSSMTARAATSVFWPGITRQIQEIRDNCPSCNRNAPSNARLPPSVPHIPSTPFEAVFADFFDFRGWHYLVLGDRLSGWTSVHRTPTGTAISGAKGLETCLRHLFITFGVPEELSSDGGPEFTAGITQDFLERWGIRHRISSAYHAQSNGRAELAVKATKRLLEENTGQNGALDTDAFAMAMLALRNTPDPDCKLSPAQILFGRQLRDGLPTINGSVPKFFDHNIRPLWRDAWASKEDALRTRYARTYEALGEHSRPLPPLQPGDRVYLQNQVGNFPKKWDRSGTILESRDHDQYVIKVDGTGRLTLRNRRFLRRLVPHGPTIADTHTTPVTSTPVTGPLTAEVPQSSCAHPITSETCAPAAEPAPTPAMQRDHSMEPTTDTSAIREESHSPPPRRSSRRRLPRTVYDAASGYYLTPNV